MFKNKVGNTDRKKLVVRKNCPAHTTTPTPSTANTRTAGYHQGCNYNERVAQYRLRDLNIGYVSMEKLGGKARQL